MGMIQTTKRILSYMRNHGNVVDLPVTPMNFTRPSYCGRTVLITGGTSGIGKCLAANFVQGGAKVIITGTNQEKLDLVKKEIPECIGMIWDVKDITISDHMMEKRKNIYGSVDILINNEIGRAHV